jgi:hypothetical protein
MHLRRFAALAAVTLLVAPAAATSTPASGLAGTVRRSPATPVCRIDTPCSAPAYVMLVFTRQGAKPARIHSSRAGAYRILLRPGTYTVATTLAGPGRIPKPTRVRVRSGHVDRLDFTIDTGIR